VTGRSLSILTRECNSAIQIGSHSALLKAFKQHPTLRRIVFNPLR
jgi:hypothetical protein